MDTIFCIVFNCIQPNNADIYAGIVFVSYTGHYPALYSSYCEPVAVPVGVSFFSTLNVGFGLLCALSQLAQIAPFLSLVFSSVNPSEMHHSPDRAMSERRAREEREMTETKNAVFLTKNGQKSHFHIRFPP